MECVVVVLTCVRLWSIMYLMVLDDMLHPGQTDIRITSVQSRYDCLQDPDDVDTALVVVYFYLSTHLLSPTVLLTGSGYKRDFFLMYFCCPLAGTLLMLKKTIDASPSCVSCSVILVTVCEVRWYNDGDVLN